MAKQYNISGYCATKAGTLPITNTWRLKHGKKIVDLKQAVVDFILENEIKYVILISRWTANIQDFNGTTNRLITDSSDITPSFTYSPGAFSRQLKNMISTLEEAEIKVLILQQVPYQKFNVPRVLVKKITKNDNTPTLGITLKEHLAFQALSNKILQDISKT